MTEKRFTIKPQDDLFGVVDNYSPDKICVVNGIRTKIETKWLCNVLNDLNDENDELKKELKVYRKLANCSNCKYQNYDWYDDGDEFEICEKGNNNQQIEYHICKEWEEF